MRGLAAIAGAALLAGCVERLPGIEGTTSLAVEITAPNELGSEAERLPDGELVLGVSVVARGADGLVDGGFAATVAVYAQFLGTLTPERGAPATAITIAAGAGSGEVTLPIAYGATTLWVEDATGAEATFATGTSPTLWYREPLLADVSRPLDEASLTALERSPLERKQVRIEASRHGESGRLVVTGVYAQGYTVSDVDCAATPCATGAYDHLFVFTFGRPRSESGAAIELGQRVAWVSGGVAEFNGFTELSFPQTELVAAVPDEGLLPAPTVILPAWLSTPIEFERVESGLVAIEGGVVCPLDDDFATYGQWKLDIGLGCGDGVNVITKGMVSEVEPAGLVGRTLPRVVGTLRAVNIGTFHVWIVMPRRLADVSLS